MTGFFKKEKIILWADKIKGMMYFSLYGDALGFPHEFNFQTITEMKLYSKEEFLKQEQCNNPWACWTQYDKIPSSQTGILSDDSFFKLEIFIPYLEFIQTSKNEISDITFIKFCLNEINLPNKPVKNQQLIDWLYMFKQSNIAEDIKKEIDSGLNGLRAKQSFYEQDNSSCFGLFLYLWSSIIGPPVSTCLDSDQGREITDFLSMALIQSLKSDSYSLCESIKIDFSDHLSYLNSLHLPKTLTATTLHSIRENEFSKKISVFKFDPEEFLYCFILADKYYPNSPLESLWQVCSSGGDTDTMGSIWGAILGAKYGFEKLTKMYPFIKKRLQANRDLSRPFWNRFKSKN